MVGSFLDILRTVSIEDQYIQFKILEDKIWDSAGKKLDEQEISVLAERICVLPIELMHTLFAHYYFELSPKETTELFGIEEPKGKLQYSCQLLSIVMGWNDPIEERSIKQAVKIAVKKYTAEEMSNPKT